MAFSIRLTNEEKALAESYAKLHSLSLGEAFKKALFDRIEDEYDVVVANEAYEDYVKDGRKSRPIEKNLVGCEDPYSHGKGLTANRSGQWRYWTLRSLFL